MLVEPIAGKGVTTDPTLVQEQLLLQMQKLEGSAIAPGNTQFPTVAQARLATFWAFSCAELTDNLIRSRAQRVPENLRSKA